MANNNFVSTEIEKVKESGSNFYFKDGLEALKNLKNDKHVNDRLDKIIKEVKDNNSYKSPSNDLDLFNKFIAYCDMNAKGSNSNGESYYVEDKRCIAKAGIRQNDWIINLARYLSNIKKNNADPYEGVSHGVTRALKYYENPKDRLPILSKSHLDLMRNLYIKGECSDSEIDAKLIEHCKTKFKGEYDNISEENLSYVYSILLYGHRTEWEVIDTKFYTEKRNVILTGAPGTGKTYLAKRIAAAIIGQDVKELDKYDENGERKVKNFEFVQFHPSYDYTDFVEGLRPYNTGTSVGFKYHSGLFRNFCERALNSKENFVIVIDEINRGEISKIFGELFFSIDPGYRGPQGSVTTQYANIAEESTTENKFKGGRFYVPENVYIIGTMNDIDRSVESMDFAFRRRFAFVEITAKDSQDSILLANPKMLQCNEIDMNEVIRVMDAVNNKLEDVGLNESYHIGAAYFAKLIDYCKSKSMWDNLWDFHLKGLLYEYFRGEPDADKKLNTILDAYKKAMNK